MSGDGGEKHHTRVKEHLVLFVQYFKRSFSGNGKSTRKAYGGEIAIFIIVRLSICYAKTIIGMVVGFEYIVSNDSLSSFRFQKIVFRTVKNMG